MEKRIYGESYKVVLNENNLVIWGYGNIPFDTYKPHPNLKFYRRGRDSWFSTTIDFYPIDFDMNKRCREMKPFTRGVDWIMSAYRQGQLHRFLFTSDAS